MPLRILSLLTLFAPLFVSAQALPITIDGKYDDWDSATEIHYDYIGDGTAIDFLTCTIANNEDYLFIRLEMAEEIELTEDNQAFIYLDTDNNSFTGVAINNIGAELAIELGNRQVHFAPTFPPVTSSLTSIKFRVLPTVSDREFEIAIGRHVFPNAFNPLFTGDTIRLAFKDWSTPNGDNMPNAGQTISYVFDHTPTPPMLPIDVEKTDARHLRLMTYNTLHNGLTDFARTQRFARIIGLAQPDVITFNECWDISASIVRTFMNNTVPLGNGETWHTIKLDAGNITASRYPILQNWVVVSGRRLTASLLDLPNDLYATDILVVNAHFKCCDGDDLRQLEADGFAKFILDAKSPGGVITLPEGTPFVLSGDLNLVGLRQQLTTLVKGEIVNTGSFGMGAPLDWDDTDLEDIVSLQTDNPMAYTWRDDNGSFPPGRLDFHICSNSVMNVEKAYTIQTEVMPAERLELYGLQQNDTRVASDHFPKITDFSLPLVTGLEDANLQTPDFQIFPNPFVDQLTIQYALPQNATIQFSLNNVTGKMVKHWSETAPLGVQQSVVSLASITPGIYFLKMSTEGFTKYLKVVKQ